MATVTEYFDEKTLQDALGGTVTPYADQDSFETALNASGASTTVYLVKGTKHILIEDPTTSYDHLFVMGTRYVLVTP